MAACLRGISKRVNLLQRRVYPTCRHLIGDDKDDAKSGSRTSDMMLLKVLAHNVTNTLSSMFVKRQYQSCRYMSSTPPDWSDKVDGIDFVATEVVPDEIIESVTTSQVVPVVNEVAIAAADSVFPVAALQYLIDGVHSFTGLSSWASIALTTVIIRGFTVPVLLIQLKATHKLNVGKTWTIWKLGTFPPGIITFYSLTQPLEKKWHLLGLGYDKGINAKKIERSVVIHFNGHMKPWSELGISKYQPYWTKYINFDHPYISSCRLFE